MRLDSLIDMYLGIPTEIANTFSWLDLSPVFGVDGFRGRIEHEVTIEAQPSGGQIRGTAKVYLARFAVSKLAPNSTTVLRIAERHPYASSNYYYGFLRTVSSRFIIIHCIEWKGN